MSRRRLNSEQSRTLILDATERLMFAEGYAAVTTRRVAAEAGLKPPLVHYYFATTEDLLIAFYLRTVDQVRERLEAALTSPRPLHALWELNADPQRAALAAEFMALANHRKSMRDVIAFQVERFRDMQTAAFARVLEKSDTHKIFSSPEAAAVVLAGIARALVMEGSIGISKGHADARASVEKLLDQLEPAITSIAAMT